MTTYHDDEEQCFIDLHEKYGTDPEIEATAVRVRAMELHEQQQRENREKREQREAWKLLANYSA